LYQPAAFRLHHQIRAFRLLTAALRDNFLSLLASRQRISRAVSETKSDGPLGRLPMSIGRRRVKAPKLLVVVFRLPVIQ
jgi:hypothetical protein